MMDYTVSTNPTGAEDHSHRLRIAALVFTIICPLFIVARTYAIWSTGRDQRGTNRMDVPRTRIDYRALMATLPLCVTGSILMIVNSYIGFGRHTSTLSHHIVERAMMIFYIDSVLYALVLGLTKTAVLGFYIRVYYAVDHFEHVCRWLIRIMGCVTVVSVIVDIFQCWPIQIAWQGSHQQQLAQCVSFEAYWWFRAGVNILTDVIICVLPTWPMHGSLMSRKKQTIVYSVFALTLIVCGIAIARTLQIKTAAFREDPTWTAVMFCVYSLIEAGMCIVVACIGPVKMLLAKYFSKITQCNGIRSVGSIIVACFKPVKRLFAQGLDKYVHWKKSWCEKNTVREASSCSKDSGVSKGDGSVGDENLSEVGVSKRDGCVSDEIISEV